MSDSSCTIVGDNNMYGLGIRLGLYLQLIATVLAAGWVPKQAENMRDVNTCFAISSLAGLLYVTYTEGPTGQIYGAEVLILIYLFAIGLFASASTEGGSIVSLDHEESIRPISVIISALLLVILSYYEVWFGYVGMDSIGQPTCPQYVFMFVQVNLFGWYRTLFKVVATVEAIGFTVLLPVSIKVITAVLRNEGPKSLFTGIELKDIGYSSEYTSRAWRYVFPIFLTIFIIAIECTIKWNNIQAVQQVGDTGQMIPLIVGVLGFIQVGYSFFTKDKDKAYGSL